MESRNRPRRPQGPLTGADRLGQRGVSDGGVPKCISQGAGAARPRAPIGAPGRHDRGLREPPGAVAPRGVGPRSPTPPSSPGGAPAGELRSPGSGRSRRPGALWVRCSPRSGVRSGWGSATVRLRNPDPSVKDLSSSRGGPGGRGTESAAWRRIPEVTERRAGPMGVESAWSFSGAAGLRGTDPLRGDGPGLLGDLSDRPPSPADDRTDPQVDDPVTGRTP